MAGTVAKKTADVHSIDSKKTDIQHVENLFQRIYDFFWEFWRQCELKDKRHSIFVFVVTCCVVSEQLLHLSLSPFFVSPFVSSL